MLSPEKLNQATMDLSGFTIAFLSSQGSKEDESLLANIRTEVKKDPVHLLIVLELYAGLNKERYEKSILPIITEFKAGLPSHAPGENASFANPSVPETAAVPASPKKPQAEAASAPKETAGVQQGAAGIESQHDVFTLQTAEGALMDLATAINNKDNKAKAAALTNVVTFAKADPVGALNDFNRLLSAESMSREFYVKTIGPIRPQLEAMAKSARPKPEPNLAGIAPAPGRQPEAEALIPVEQLKQEVGTLTERARTMLDQPEVVIQTTGAPAAQEKPRGSAVEEFTRQFGEIVSEHAPNAVIGQPVSAPGEKPAISTDAELAQSDVDLLEQLAMLEKELEMTPGEISGKHGEIGGEHAVVVEPVPAAMPEGAQEAPAAQRIDAAAAAKQAEVTQALKVAKEMADASTSAQSLDDEIKAFMTQAGEVMQSAKPVPEPVVISPRPELAPAAVPPKPEPAAIPKPMPITAQPEPIPAPAPQTSATDEDIRYPDFSDAEAIKELEKMGVKSRKPAKPQTPAPSLQRPLTESAMGVDDLFKPAAQQPPAPATCAPSINAALDALFGRNQPASDYMAAVKAKAAARQALVEIAQAGSQKEVADRLFADVLAVDPVKMDSMAKSDSYSKAVLALRDIGCATPEQLGSLRMLMIKFRNARKTDITGNFEEACGTALGVLEKKAAAQKTKSQVPGAGTQPQKQPLKQNT